FFFFQAEDGIRDRNVTGVQTCALPISGAKEGPLRRLVHHRGLRPGPARFGRRHESLARSLPQRRGRLHARAALHEGEMGRSLKTDRKSTRLNSSHVSISYAVFCLKKKK